ncbi:hypothetical protein AC792_05295 [Arthrobacter sp. RIT-PI-e]|uniref:hypothetical protein n=1 Tax=Arthrobacter sp. RIT-PI-e TaxID=1681197 RepID=UPI0006767D2B|nr:hypothetical protein [Arthrobacter sp. RIT-PI-e]KNC19619.1 hypothetical protein AC792_05295 [Arthrobacter sp. RIT-PI-e]
MSNRTKKIGSRTGIITAVAALGVGLLSPVSAAYADEEAPTIQQLTEDCDGSGWNHGGTGWTMFLDGCTFEEESSTTYKDWKAVGDTVTNCTADRGVIDQALTGSESWSSGGSIGGSASAVKSFFTGGLSGEYNWNHTVTETNASTIHVEPGRKATLTAGAEIHEKKGRIRVNYSSQLAGHYIWYINDVTISTPTGYTETGQDNKDCSETLLNGR